MIYELWKVNTEFEFLPTPFWHVTGAAPACCIFSERWEFACVLNFSSVWVMPAVRRAKVRERVWWSATFLDIAHTLRSFQVSICSLVIPVIALFGLLSPCIVLEWCGLKLWVRCSRRRSAKLLSLFRASLCTEVTQHISSHYTGPPRLQVNSIDLNTTSKHCLPFCECQLLLKWHFIRSGVAILWFVRRTVCSVFSSQQLFRSYRDLRRSWSPIRGVRGALLPLECTVPIFVLWH